MSTPIRSAKLINPTKLFLFPCQKNQHFSPLLPLHVKTRARFGRKLTVTMHSRPLKLPPEPTHKQPQAPPVVPACAYRRLHPFRQHPPVHPHNTPPPSGHYARGNELRPPLTVDPSPHSRPVSPQNDTQHPASRYPSHASGESPPHPRHAPPASPSNAE